MTRRTWRNSAELGLFVRMNHLSETERVIFNLRRDGYTHAEIARKLNIRSSTSRSVVTRIYDKLQIDNVRVKPYLTDYQKQMAALRLSGKTLIQVAVEMNLAAGTARGEMTKIYRKYNVHSIEELREQYVVN